MSSYNITKPTVGRSGGYPFFRRCPTGEIVSQIKVRAGTSANQICAICSDGTDLGCHGGHGGSDLYLATPLNNTTYYHSIRGRQGNRMDQIMGYGSNGGDPFYSTCPTGINKYVNGIHGYSGTKLNKVGSLCGVEKNDFCTNYNLENSICSSLSIDDLNKACNRDFSKTCRNKVQQLYEPTVKKFCKDNPTDDLCSCYSPPPPGMPDVIRESNPRCWNRKCATSGYKPPGMAPCNRSITICKQSLGSLGGDSNLFTGNVQVLECNPNPSRKPPIDGTGAYVPALIPPYTGDTNTQTIFDKKTLGINNKILFVILFIAILLLYTSDDDVDDVYINPKSYTQPNYSNNQTF
jgi:hypothetical protein